MTLETLSCDTFAAYLGDAFLLADAGLAGGALTLVEATPGRVGFGDRTFTLVFRSDRSDVMPQGLYALHHAALGRLEIFLVPLRRVADGIDYAATFS